MCATDLPRRRATSDDDKTTQNEDVEWHARHFHEPPAENADVDAHSLRRGDPAEKHVEPEKHI
jgi:hypothetical protein